MFAKRVVTEARLRGTSCDGGAFFKVNSPVLKFLAFDRGVRQREALCRRPVVSEKAGDPEGRYPDSVPLGRRKNLKH